MSVRPIENEGIQPGHLPDEIPQPPYEEDLMAHIQDAAFQLRAELNFEMPASIPAQARQEEVEIEVQEEVEIEVHVETEVQHEQEVELEDDLPPSSPNLRQFDPELAGRLERLSGVSPEPLQSIPHAHGEIVRSLANHMGNQAT